ncbi:MAG: extracellular solute-binding protein, partial [Pseudomonadota bacterium]
MIQRTRLFASLSLLVGAVVACSNPAETNDAPEAAEAIPTLTLYSARHYDSDKALFAMFEEQAGVNIDVREAKADQLIETMKAEGDMSPADVIITADAGSLWRFQEAGLTQPLLSETLTDIIPANYREPEGHWHGMARRLRGIAYDPARWNAEDLATWDTLAGEDKAGEICVRSSSNIYNLSLMGELIHRYGSEAAGEWATSIVTNMARNPQGGDTDQLRGLVSGECDVSISNTYYLARAVRREV